MKTIGGLILSSRLRKLWQLLLMLAVILTPLAFVVQTVHAEGSVDLIDSGGYRPYLYYNTRIATNFFPLSTIIYVYAQEGETINLGSSANGLRSGRIEYTAPTGVSSVCSTTAPTGRIYNRSQELAGPLPNPGGYRPCVVTVGAGQTGVWEIRFVSPRPDATDLTKPPDRLATSNWTQPSNVSYVIAWDVTVRDAAGNTIPGRAFTDYASLYVGSPDAALSSEVYIQTRDGYRYRVDYNGARPQFGAFFVNDKGLMDSTTGNPLYRSMQMVTTSGRFWLFNFPAGVTLDLSPNSTHKIFFNIPDYANLPESAPAWMNGKATTTWLDVSPAVPVQPANFSFTGNEGTAGQAGTYPMGGHFTFESTIESTYQIVVDVNRDGTFGNANDRFLKGTTVVGSNTVAWDGLDGNGVPIPAGPQTYSAKVMFVMGEIHFPFVDVEDNPHGIIIERQAPVVTATDPYLVYYNDEGLTGRGGPSPRSALNGISSLNGAHRYSASFGDRRVMDTWTYLPSESAILAGGIRLAEADLEIIKTHAPEPVTAGGPITYTITVINHGPSNVTGATVTDLFPAEILNPSWTCAITSGTGSCSASGTGNINTTVDLNVNAVATFTVSGTVSSAVTGSITNSATVTRPPDVNDPDLSNNSDSDTATVIRPRPYITVTKTANPTSIPESGADVTFTFVVTNDDQVAVTLDSLTDSVFGNLNGQGSCAVPQAIPVSGSYTCMITKFLSGNAGSSHVNVVTAAASDSFGNHSTATDDATVTFTDVLPEISVVKTANPTSVPETGADVTFTFLVTNNSSEAVTLSSLTDSVFGDLNGLGNCAVPQSLAAHASYTCALTRTILGDYGTSHINTVTAQASDDDGNTVSASDDATVTFTDVLPQIRITKTADPTSIPETGGAVTFTFQIANLVSEPVRLTSLVDDRFGDLTAECGLPVDLPANGQVSCQISRNLAGDYPEQHVNIVTATAEDDDGNQVEAQAQAVVTFTDVLPEIEVVKIAKQTSALFTGARVIFKVQVFNRSAEPVVLTELVDDPFGNLTSECGLPVNLAPEGQSGDSFTCHFARNLAGEPGSQHVDTATATAVDDEGNSVSAQSSARVDFFWYGLTYTVWRQPSKLSQWPAGYTPTMLVREVFAVPLPDGSILDLNGDGKEDTLLDALWYAKGDDAIGIARRLLQASVAAVLNEAAFGEAFPPYGSVEELISEVNAALASNSIEQMLNLANTLDYWNRGTAP